MTGHSSERPERRQIPCEERCALRAWRSWVVQTHWLGFVQKWGYPNILINWWFWGIYNIIYIYIYTVCIDGIHNYDYCNHVILGIHHIFMHFQTYARPTMTTCHCLIGEPCQPLRSHEHSTRFLVSALPLQADSFRAFLNYLQGAEGKVLGQTAEDRLNIRVDPGDFCLRHSTTMRVLMSSRFAAPQSTRSPVGNLCSWWFGP